MIKIIVHAFVDEVGVVEVLFASSDHQKVASKFSDYQASYPNDYLAIYDLPLDTELNQLAHYPSVAIEKSDFE
ncbi:phosphoribosylaminoimidazole carboxylase [Streptococcus oricebi]|uniref:Phosphoribosylaminoimidazole carboxylase n=1 Tax=Streptococcus oricebi TaxID=1547447 RepID=A0ABS5B701_9STRE|nr:phosphoribosylaminoimidazole carboxylase [Streptococcus oricebi]MBP2624288.1 phosphoribosylaminoimidazole carboxylase [Streptococcus oricebi]